LNRKAAGISYIDLTEEMMRRKYDSHSWKSLDRPTEEYYLLCKECWGFPLPFSQLDGISCTVKTGVVHNRSSNTGFITNAAF
jgi:hypothetical protein